MVSWWTSGSEAAALNALFAGFRASNPGVEVVNGAVPGGAGSNAIVALAKRLQRDDPPDVWQTFAGKSVQGYARRGVVRSVASVYESDDLRGRMNPTILRSVMRDGRPYGVPTGAHRSNVLWFNKRVLEKAGVSPPSSGYTLAAFVADLAKVKASGTAPLCLGGKDPFTTVELFENTLLSSIGKSGWKDMVSDDLDWRGKQVRTALKQFGVMLGYADPQASGLTWDQATKKLAAGGCAFESMNDSAYGELVAAGAQEGKDFGATAFPGTDASFLAVVDVFVAATGAKNAKNALAFLGGINKPATQLAFNSAKGSVPVVRDVDVSSLPRLPARLLEGPMGIAAASVDRARRGDEPRVPGGLLRGGIDLRANPGRGRVRRRPRGRCLQGQAPAALRPGRRVGAGARRPPRPRDRAVALRAAGFEGLGAAPQPVQLRRELRRTRRAHRGDARHARPTHRAGAGRALPDRHAVTATEAQPLAASEIRRTVGARPWRPRLVSTHGGERRWPA